MMVAANAADDTHAIMVAGGDANAAVEPDTQGGDHWTNAIAEPDTQGGDHWTRRAWEATAT